MTVASPPSPQGEPLVSWSMLAMIAAVVLQTGALVWWAASKTADLDRRTAALEETVAPLSSGMLARIDERTQATNIAIERVEKRLDRMEPRS